MLPLVKEFQKCDLYSKSDRPEVRSLALQAIVGTERTQDKPDPVALKPYYQSLIEKYFPIQELKW